MNTKKFRLAFCFMLFAVASYGQNIEKIAFNPTDTIGGYYLAVKPQSETIQGVLVLFPGFGQAAETIFPETKLHNVGFLNEVLTIGLSNGEKIYTDQQVITRLNLVLDDIKKRFKIAPDRFILGGFSAGGTIALRYTELCYEQPSKYPVLPAGVFAIDSPVDLINIYQYFQREIKRNYSTAGMNEAIYIKGIMDKELGALSTSLENHIQHSPFYTERDNGNERWLKNVAVRVYHDIDVNWKLKNRRRSIFDSNELCSSEMISRLMLMGNEKAEFMVGRTGYRSNGMRHPHSWSIVEEVELIQWLKQTLQFFPEFYQQPYTFLTPETMYVEKERFPLSFAPSIDHSGVADIRFLPGFSDEQNEQFWSYCYVWALDGNVDFNEAVLKSDLQKYYTGLSKSQTEATLAIKKVKSEPGFAQTYYCTINTFDHLITKKPIVLQGKINIKPCTTSDKTLAFFQISSKPYTAGVWKSLDQFKTTVDCKK